MRDDASRARLEEMGIDLYVARIAHDAVAGGRATSELRRAETPHVAPARGRARVAVIARAEGAPARTLLAQVVRALGSARIDVAVASDAARTGDADGIVVFGAALAREVGAAVPAERQKSIAWVGAAELAEIGHSAAAKRALWSEIKRLAAALAKTANRPGST